MTTLLDLKKICDAATPGPWTVGVDGFPVGAFSTGNSSLDGKDYCVSFEHKEFGDGDAKNDAAHIATFNPARTAAMIELLMEGRRIFTTEIGADTPKFIHAWLAKLAAFEGAE